jgi:hypothetical protein
MTLHKMAHCFAVLPHEDRTFRLVEVWYGRPEYELVEDDGVRSGRLSLPDLITADNPHGEFMSGPLATLAVAEDLADRLNAEYHGIAPAEAVRIARKFRQAIAL